MKSTKISWFIATGFFSGLSPVSPGTIGSLAAIGAWYYLVSVYPSLFYYLPFIILGVFLAGLIASHFELKQCEGADPQHIVIDEWTGMLIPLLLTTPDRPIEIFIAFAAFRFFDITKIEPARWFEKLPDAWGIMCDDVVAGCYAYGLLWMVQNHVPGM